MRIFFLLRFSLYTHSCQTLGVCKWHHNPSPHQWWRRVCISTGSGAAGAPVWANNPELEKLKSIEMMVDFMNHRRCASCCPTALFQPSRPSRCWELQSLRTWSGKSTSRSWKRPWQWMYFLQLLRKHGLPQELLRQFYAAVTEYVLRSSIIV